ncbi:MAG: leucine efflux protein LeuE [Betaproteobacteria bacterium]|nr:leucine efflux protein LeuE [Betaproteobacteria bacterium]MBU6513667.1 leucine efflux protein LeuE [Betaproteobacteria bacterium]MDE1956806.1 leucine efflux protein LeuE [Betaproteobacteria bacterium]MDE2154047.1 leucine efflux protein LeuE [Betaproteobacteria bacterium]MDE2477764.1 leucine efflux protein LeuE [Betaproteobacteria bacterium]
MHPFGITDLPLYVLGVVFIVLLPGPNSLYVLGLAAQRGVRTGYLGALGIFLGDSVLMVLAAAGLASLLATVAWLFMLVKFAGAAYLAWIGLGMLRAGLRNWRRAEAAAVPPAKVDASHPLGKALLISLLNPKAILFFISFFIQFVQPGYAHPALSFLILGAIVQFFSLLYLSTLIFAGARLADAFRRRRRVAAGLTGALGGAFMAFSVRLATASPH